MDSSRRAVESYWRSRMIDAATSDEDKVTPVYKLDEICELLRSSHVSIVKEIVEFILKRLEHKSPIVKQKALRVIKYAVGKSGVDFRREMQRHSVAVRNLIHYRGQPDPLKGDALNKAVRETAQEAIAALFAAEESITKPAPAVGIGKKMEGFGNTNYVVQSDDNKSFLSEVVDLGTATLKQGITSLAQGRGLSGITQVHMQKKNGSGSYRAPNLRRSLTTEIEYSEKRYEPVQYEKQGSFGSSSNAGTGSWNVDSRNMKSDTSAGDSSSRHIESKTREERLLDTIATSGGVRLQPTRDAIQAFLLEAAKVDAVALSHAIEKKLQSPQWQVRVKAICVLESIIRKNDDEHFSIIAYYFTESKDVLVSCSESPQASLRERAVKVLKLLSGEPTNGLVAGAERQTKVETSTVVQMPDLIDTGDADNLFGAEGADIKSDQSRENVTPPVSPLIDDLFGNGLGTGGDSSDQKNVNDPFADVSFHSGEGNEQADDLFSGMTVDEKAGASESNILSNENKTEVFDIFGSSSELQEHGSHKSGVDNLMAGLSINDKQKENYSQEFSGSADLHSQSNGKVASDALSSLLGSQPAGMNSNAMFTPSTLPYSLPPGVMLNPAYPQAINYGSMGNYYAQQQLLAAMSNLQHFGNLSSQSTGINQVAGTSGGNSAPLPDIFQPNYVAQIPSSTISSKSSKEDTKAFDFISEHLPSKRLV